MIKPDGAHRGLIDEIISRFEKKGFYLKGLKLQNMEKSFAGSTRPICPFFGRLVECIVSDHGRGNATATTIAKSKWGPYSGAGDFAGNMAVILASLLAALALALAIHAGVRHLLRPCRQRLRGAAAEHPEKPPAVEVAPAPALLQLVYSASGMELAGSASECAICLAEFADGDAVRAVPACGHGFHARCIERWLAPGGRRSSCPTCRAPASTLVPPAPAPDGAPAS